MLLSQKTWCHVVALQPFLLLLPTIEGALGSTGLSLSLLPSPSCQYSPSLPLTLPLHYLFPSPPLYRGSLRSSRANGTAQTAEKAPR